MILILKPQKVIKKAMIIKLIQNNMNILALSPSRSIFFFSPTVKIIEHVYSYSLGFLNSLHDKFPCAIYLALIWHWIYMLINFKT